MRSAYATNFLAPTARFNTFWVDDGLANNGVTTMAQDNHGFIWLGTYNGLSRFDGYQFKNFYADGQPGALSDDYIRALLVDSTGVLWLATERGGLNRYDDSTQTFSHYRHGSNDSQSVSADSVRTLLDNGDGTFWLGTSRGLDLFDSHNGQVSMHYATAPVRSLLESTAGQLWMATEAGIYLFQPKQQRLTEVTLPGLAAPAARALAEDEQGNIWIATTQGLFKRDRATGQIMSFEQILKSPARILSLAQGPAGSIWAGSTYHGLYHISADGHVKQYRYDKNHQFALADNAVVSLFNDAGGVLWVGTLGGGASRLTVDSLAFGLHDDSVDSVACLPSAKIYSIFGEPGNRQISQKLWLGTDSGLVQIAGRHNDCKVYQANGAATGSLPYPNVKAIYRDNKRQLWLGLSRGLAKYDASNDRFDLASKTLNQANINFITEINRNRLLIATTKGLFIQGKNGADFSHVDAIVPGFQHTDIHVSAKDTSGKLWFGTEQGLAFFDPSKGSVEPWMSGGKAGKKSAFDLPVRALYIDAQFNAWVGSTNAGFYKLALQSGAIEKIGHLDGLAATAKFNAILADDVGLLWLSSSHGLLRFDIATAESHLFRATDGLQSDNFLLRSALKTSDGLLYFGGRKGFNRFDPQHIRLNLQPPKVGITGFSHFNRQIKPQDASGPFQLPQAIEQTRQLDLSHRDYVFGFEFSALDYADPARNQYAYQLSGFDEHWNHTDANNRRITYSNLAAGQYTFRVKAANKDGVWNEQGLALTINVAAAPWATPWAYATYVFFVIAAIVAFFKYRTAALRQSAFELQLSVDERTAQLNQEKQKVELLLAQKNDEFANVSHEFRTPLTLVLGPVAQLLNSDIGDVAKQKLDMVRRNGYRLLRMVDQLLQMEKFKVQQSTNKSVVAVQPILNLLGQSFQDLAAQQQIKLEIEAIDDVYLHFMPDGLEKIMLNLLSNALKYTPAGG